MALSLYEVAQSVLLCMCGGLASQSVPWEGECCVVQDTPLFNNCCETGGFAWARVLRTYPSTRFPNADDTTDQEDCSVLWAAQLEVGHARCVCYTDCDCESRGKNAKLVLDDAEAAIRGIACCFEGGSCSGVDYRIQTQEMLDGRGGCGGSKITIAVRHQVCCP